jgi:hypothetical protein
MHLNPQTIYDTGKRTAGNGFLPTYKMNHVL